MHDLIKNKESELNPNSYDKLAYDYIIMYKVAESEAQLDKIKDPRLRARKIMNLEEKALEIAEKIILSHQE